MESDESNWDRDSSSSSLNNEGEAIEMEKRKFFIMDTEAVKDAEIPDHIKAEIQIIFFYPPDIPWHGQLLWMDSAASLRQYVKDFGIDSPKIVKFEDKKLACKYIEPYAMGLTGRLDEPDLSLMNLLDMIYRGFQLLEGSFARVERITKKYEQDADHVDEDAVKAQDKKPHEENEYGEQEDLSHDGYPDERKRAKWGYTKNRLEFVKYMRNTWNRMTPLIKTVDETMERAMNVTFQHIAFADVQRGGSRHFIQASQLMQAAQHCEGVLSCCILYNASVLCSQFDSSTTFWMVLVYELLQQKPKSNSQNKIFQIFLRNEVIASLRASARKPYPSAKRYEYQNTEGTPFAPEADGDFVGVIIIVHGAIAMIIVTEHAINPSEFVNEMTATYHPKLAKLEDDIIRSLEDVPTFPLNSSDTPEYILYDRVDRSLHASINTPFPERAKSTRLTASLMHETYENNEQVSCQILCDHMGAMYSSKTFGRETYAHIKGLEYGIGPELIDLSRPEQLAHDYLKSQQVHLP